MVSGFQDWMRVFLLSVGCALCSSYSCTTQIWIKGILSSSLSCPSRPPSGESTSLHFMQSLKMNGWQPDAPLRCRHTHWESYCLLSYLPYAWRCAILWCYCNGHMWKKIFVKFCLKASYYKFRIFPTDHTLPLCPYVLRCWHTNYLFIHILQYFSVSLYNSEACLHYLHITWLKHGWNVM